MNLKEKENVIRNESVARRTRQSKINFVKCDFSKTEWFKNTVSYLGPKHWEILPNLFVEEGFV